MYADLEASLCREFAGLGDFNSSSARYGVLLQRIQAAEQKARAAGRFNDYALNFREANDALNSIRNILNYWGSPSPGSCLVEQRGNYIEALRSTTPVCATFLNDSAYEQVIARQMERFNQALSPVERVMGVSAPSAPTGVVESVVQSIKDVFFEEEPPAPVMVRPKPAPSSGTVALVQKMFGGKTVSNGTIQYPGAYGQVTQCPPIEGPYDEARAARDPFYDYCYQLQSGVPLGPPGSSAAQVAQVLKSSPDSIATPQPGTVPVTITPDGISKILSSLAAGWTSIEQARLQQSLLKAMSRGQKAYLPQPMAQQMSPSWGLIAGGAGLMILGGFLIYMIAKKNGGSAAPAASVKAAVPAIPGAARA